MKNLRMIELFSGIGAQERALRQIGVPYEVTATCDLDPDAILSYAEMRFDFDKEFDEYDFPSQDQMIKELTEKNVGYDFKKDRQTITSRTPSVKLKRYYLADKLTKNLGDISKVKELPQADIVFHSSPCQSYSCAGLGDGGDEGSGTTSSLMWESVRLIRQLRPTYVIWENVANVLSDKHKHNFIKYLEQLSEIGYKSSFDLLNAKDYGIPQNRLRIFCISKLDSEESPEDININKYSPKAQQVYEEIKSNKKIKIWNSYKFPETIRLNIRLRDILENDVSEQYYLDDEKIVGILDKMFEKIKADCGDEVNQIGNCMPYPGRDNPNQGRIYDENGISPSLTTMQGGGRQPFIVASRGRDPENPSNRKTGAHLEQRLEPNELGISNCITSVSKDNYVCEPKIAECIGGIGEKKSNGGTQYYQQDRVYCGDIALAHPANIPGGSYKYVVDDTYANRDPRIYDDQSPTIRSERHGLKVIASENSIKYRVRKLTEKECFRLMGFSDDDYERASEYCSKSSLYKQCGNSIVVACLIGIFSSLFVEDGFKKEVWTKYFLNYK